MQRFPFRLQAPLHVGRAGPNAGFSSFCNDFGFCIASLWLEASEPSGSEPRADLDAFPSTPVILGESIPSGDGDRKKALTSEQHSVCSWNKSELPKKSLSQNHFRCLFRADAL